MPIAGLGGTISRSSMMVSLGIRRMAISLVTLSNVRWTGLPRVMALVLGTFSDVRILCRSSFPSLCTSKVFSLFISSLFKTTFRSGVVGIGLVRCSQRCSQKEGFVPVVPFS